MREGIAREGDLGHVPDAAPLVKCHRFVVARDVREIAGGGALSAADARDAVGVGEL